VIINAKIAGVKVDNAFWCELKRGDVFLGPEHEPRMVVDVLIGLFEVQISWLDTGTRVIKRIYNKDTTVWVMT
jgi:hypothetical protein